jgi:hypothetical protein
MIEKLFITVHASELMAQNKNGLAFSEKFIKVRVWL